MPNLLDTILAHKEKELQQKMQKISLRDMRREAESARFVHRPFQLSLEKIKSQSPAIIAEIKQASPSLGLLTRHFDPILIARQYERAGAQALSVLTDNYFFKGCDNDLIQARQATMLPVLRKDFIISPYQIWESQKMGADALLLIVAALPPVLCHDLITLANEVGIEVLLEVHNASELAFALEFASRVMIGINNRNLGDFTVSIETSLALLKLIKRNTLFSSFIVSESGIKTHEELKKLQKAGASAFLIGETLLKSKDLEKTLTELLGVR